MNRGGLPDVLPHPLKSSKVIRVEVEIIYIPIKSQIVFS